MQNWYLTLVYLPFFFFFKKIMAILIIIIYYKISKYQSNIKVIIFFDRKIT